MQRRTLLTAAALAATTVATGCSTGPGGGTDAPHSPDAKGGGGPATTSTGRVPAPRTSAAAPDWSALAHGLDGRLVRPQDATYDSARRLYNTRFDDLKPAAIAYVAGESDIQECLAFARAHSTPVSIRNGGHSYAGWSSGNGRLVIDISALDSLSRASDGIIGAGAKLADVYRALARHGRTIPAGSCPTVGISGLTLGGGHGVAARAYGLTCDSLVSATLITADGKRLTADARREKDLFWALRGAGNGNFGVVTELRFDTHPAPTTTSAYLTWPWSKAADVIAAWQEWGPDQPDEIWSSLHLDAGPGGVAPTLSVSAFGLGGESGLRDAVDRLGDRAGYAASVSLRERGYEEAMLVYAGCSGYSEDQCRLPGETPGRALRGALKRETYAAASDFFDRSLSADGIRALVAAADRYTRLPTAAGGTGSLSLTALGGAVNRVDPLATSFVHRGSRMLAQYIAAWPHGTAGTTQRAWLKSAHGSMRGYASGAAYQNYVDPTLPNWRSAYYGPAAERLSRLKKRYDPDRLFDFPQAL
ncbi:FAD-binding oxidoreductase [Streptomyces sp. NPDC088258]|uniref:FAD-binding oxidoreductase n=1 Tax=Streptomyces sp. NPDC088258 TaxID=3365849 RepID=UPI0038188D74